MKIVFLGTPEFAVASLDALVREKFEVAGVVTAPDKPAGRGRKLQASAVKQYALANGLRLLQPTNLKDQMFQDQLRALGADVQVVVAFRMLPEQVWSMPRHGTFNVHASLLPKYRGAAPINRAIMEGAKETGVTVFKLQHAVDTGSILIQEKHPIGEDTTAGELHDELKIKGANLIVKAMKMLAGASDRSEGLQLSEQYEEAATHAPKIFREDCAIDWNRSRQQVHNQVRGLSPYPAAFTYITDGNLRVLMKVLRTKLSEYRGEGTNGSLVADDEKLRVRCSDGWLVLEEVQMEGKRRMQAAEFLKGFRLSGKERLDSRE